MRFQVFAEIEHRRGERAFLEEEQRDQQAADPSVPVLERMDQLELRMHHGHLDQRSRIRRSRDSVRRLRDDRAIAAARAVRTSLVRSRNPRSPASSDSPGTAPGVLFAPLTLSIRTPCIDRMSDKVRGRSASASVARVRALR